MAGAGVVVPERDRALFEARAEAWAEDLGAEGELEGYLASRAALASVRLDRCARQETAALAEKRARALSAWWRERRDRASVGYYAEKLEKDPAAALLALEDSSLGCEWLSGRWAELARLLEASGGWDERSMLAALHYLGVSARPDVDSSPALSRFWAAGLALRGNAGRAVGMVELERYFAITVFASDPSTRIAAAGEGLPEAAEAVVTLRDLCEAEQARLESRRCELWHDVDVPSQLRAVDLASFDDSPSAMLRLRYEAASRSDLHRAIEQVRKNRRARDFEPEGEARNEPNEVEIASPEILEQKPLPPAPPAEGGPIPTGEFRPAPDPQPGQAARPTSPPDSTRNEADESDGWEVDDEDAEDDLATLVARVDDLCPA